MTSQPIETPPITEFVRFTDAPAAVDRLVALYEEAIGFLARRFAEVAASGRVEGRIRAFYPEIRISIDTHARLDSRLAFGYVQGPGAYATTVTRPDLFRRYLTIQIEQLLANHGVPVEIGASDLPIPLHFALTSDVSVTYDVAERIGRPIRDVFDVPDLAVTDDAIVNGTWTNGTWTPRNGEAAALAPEAIQVMRLIIDPGCVALIAVMIRTQNGWQSIERQHHEAGSEFVERLD